MQLRYAAMQCRNDLGIETPLSFQPEEVQHVLVAEGSEKAQRSGLDRRKCLRRVFG